MSTDSFEEGRRRRRLIAGVTAAALCVTGIATAALVVTLRGHGTETIAPQSIFIPIAGPANAAGGSPGSGAAALAAPNSSSSQGAAAPLAKGLAAYPGSYYSSCGSGSTLVANGQIQVQGIATVGSPGQATDQQLTIQVSGAGGTNKAAVIDAQAREAAIHDAVLAAGVPSAGIALGPVQVGQNGYIYYGPNQPSKPSASAVVTVTSGDPVLLGSAADAAEKAGGAQVSSYASYGVQVNTPSSGDLATALDDATRTAHDQALLAASAASLHLGKVSGLTTSPPSLCYGAGGERLVVTVTINYSVSS